MYIKSDAVKILLLKKKMFDFKKYVMVSFKKYISKMVLLRCDNISFEKKIGEYSEVVFWCELNVTQISLTLAGTAKPV